jgi:serine/threonine protein kinase
MSEAQSNGSSRCPDCGAGMPAGIPTVLCPSCGLTGALENSEEPFQPSEFGDYELLAEIARGGMGVVYKARQKSLDRIVAVKMLLSGSFASDELIRRFKVEATFTASLRHPNIVAVHEVGCLDGQHFLVMDYVDGPNLANLVHDEPLSPQRAAVLVQTIAEAIHYAHEKEVLHRDLKPSNILIDSNDQPHVTDFGLARHIDGESSLTLSGQVLGSLSYIPPEQAAALHQKVGRQSDVYGLGAILYHLLTARPPFQGGTMAETVRQVMNDDPTSPRAINPAVPRNLETICLKCLEKEPERRYESADQLRDELERFLRDAPIEAVPVRGFEKVVRWCQRKPVVASLTAAVVVTALAGIIGWIERTAATAQARAEKTAAEEEAEKAKEESDQTKSVLIANTDLLLKKVFHETNDLNALVLLQALDKAAQQHSSELIFWEAKAEVLARVNRVDEAIVAVSQALELSTANGLSEAQVELLLTRCEWLRRAGRKNDADADYFEAGRINCQQKGIPSRNPATSPALLDLSPYYRSELSSWLDKIVIQDGPPGDSLEARVERSTGIKFDLRGVLDLLSVENLTKRRQKALASFTFERLQSHLPPNGLVGVSVNQRFGMLHLLHGCWDVGPSPANNTIGIGHYVLRYSDGETRRIPLLYGQHVRDIWRRDSLPAHDASVALRGAPVSKEGATAVQLFHTALTNPRPDVVVQSMDFVMLAETVSPILLAATVEKGKPGTYEFLVTQAAEAGEKDGIEAEIKIFEEAFRQSPTDSRVWYWRGKALERWNRTNDAMAAYTRAIEIAQTHNTRGRSAALHARSQIWRKLGRHQEAAADNCEGLLIPPRPSGLRGQLIDLSAFYNGRLNHYFREDNEQGRLNFVAQVQQQAGMEFDLRGYLSAYGKGAESWGRVPGETSFVAIPIRQTFSRLHVITCALYSDGPGTRAGAYIFHFANGQTVEWPIIAFQNIGSDAGATPLSQGLSITTDGTNRKYNFYKATWENPFPDVEVTSVDFVSAMSRAAPRLFAMTVE